jgi:SAM-dependent methyltransferase
MKNCRLCENEVDDSGAIILDVPAGTQLFSDDAATAEALKTKIAIIECPHCSLIQLTGEPVAYDQVSSSSSFVSGQLTQHRLEQLHKLFKLRPLAKGYARLLEIGCGDGHLLDESRGMFEHSVGIEPTSRNALLAAGRGLNVHQMLMARDVKVPGAPFQYFCSFHVLEHVTQVRSVLQGIASALDDDGVGVIEVPSTEAAFENQRFGDFMPDHLNYFTEKTLHGALEWSGFSVIDITRDWGGEHLVAYVRKRPSLSKVGRAHV